MGGGGHLQVVRILMRAGADVESRDADNLIPRDMAGWGGYQEVVQRLS